MSTSTTHSSARTTAAPAVAHRPWTVLRGDGVGVVIHHDGPGLPRVLHWGADLGPLDDAACDALAAALGRQTPPATLDAAWELSVLPQESDGWAGRPGLDLVRDGAPVYPRWVVTDVHDVAGGVGHTTGPGRAVEFEAADDAAGLRVTTRLAIEAGGLVSVVHALTSTAPGALGVGWLEATLPVPRQAVAVTTFGGRWTREKAPRTTAFPDGPVTRTSRRGRPGHDNPWVLLATDAAASGTGTDHGPGSPNPRAGQVWGVHLAWPADSTYRTDRMTDQRPLIGAGELLRSGEIVLGDGETYTTPPAYFAWSDRGLDGLSARFHAFLRARPQHPRRPRPLVLNTWEAFYFDQEPARVLALADRAAAVGVERFVLDDGWFLGRRDDTRGLGDWVVDPAVWPDGLEPLAARVHGHGMELGLWFEPEMVNLDSDLARAHPDWLLDTRLGPDADAEALAAGLSWRHQHVLDLANPAAYAHVRDAISAVIGRLGVDFVKWDHNRDLVESVHAGRPGLHAQTRAVLRLMAELKDRHPGLEIESCSSGGARADLGILAVADRVWASDSNDPVERQDIQRWTQLLLPPELVGAHVGPAFSHSSGRFTELSYRAATALMGHAGFEWDLSALTDDELAAVTRFGALYRELRHVVHGGTVVHSDTVDPALRVVGAVLPDASEGVWTVATVATLADARTETLHLHGLDPARTYRVRVRDDVAPARTGPGTPPWLAAREVTLPGAVLRDVGLQLPTLWPLQALILHVVAV